MKQLVIKVILFTGLVTAVLYLCDDFFVDGQHRSYQSFQSIYQHEKNSIDVVFLGNSHLYMGVDNFIIENTNNNENIQNLLLNKISNFLDNWWKNEVLVNNNINLQFGYNYLKRKELNFEGLKGGGGFSYGFLLKIKRICINYARSIYNISGGSNSVSLSLNLKKIIN